MREQKANDNGFPVVGKQAKEQQTFPFDQLVKYDGATNKITINANLTINGDTNIGELDIDSGDAPKGQVLTANGQSGASWGFPSMERIVDLNDNFRFVEGNGTVSTDILSNITITYNKWSLSGTHFMWVIAGTIDAPSTIDVNHKNLGILPNLPTFIYDKIVPILSVSIGIFKLNVIASNGTWTEYKFFLGKNNDPNIKLYANAISPEYSKIIPIGAFRIQFDLLIDAE